MNESHIICRWMSFDDKTRLLRAPCLFIVFTRGFVAVIGFYRELTVDAYGCFDYVMLQNCLRFESMFLSLKDYSEALYILNIVINRHMH